MEKTYNYIFWHNHHEGLWYAVPKDDYLAFFGGKRETLTTVLSNENIDELVKLITQ